MSDPIPGLTITPGNFNAPRPPSFSARLMVWPQTPAPKRQRIFDQYQTKYYENLVVVDGLAVTYVRFEYTEGIIFLEVEPDGELPDKEKLMATGARYVTRDIYTILDLLGSENRYKLKTAKLFTPQPPTGTHEHPSGAYPGIEIIDIGAIFLEQGFDRLTYDRILIKLPYQVATEGTGDEGEYEFHLMDNSPDGQILLEGELLLSVTGIRGGGAYGGDENVIPIDTNVYFSATLLRDGAPFDRVTIFTQVTGQVTVRALDGTVEQTPQPVITLDDSKFIETLFGATASNPRPRQPSMPFTSYIRESYAKTGQVTFPS